MTNDRCWRSFGPSLWLTLVLGALVIAPTAVAAQMPGVENGQWKFLGGDEGHTRYTPAAQIDASNFNDLEVAWQFQSSSFTPSTTKSTGTYIDGKFITVTGERRHVIALDPATGELLWSFTEPNTARYQYSMRKGYGKGIAYGEIDGRGVVYITTPSMMLLCRGSSV